MSIEWNIWTFVGTGITAFCLILFVVLAVMLLNNRFSKEVRGYLKDLQQTINEVLKRHAQTDDEIRQWSQEFVLEMRAKAQSLLDKEEELYSSTRAKLRGFLDRLQKLRKDVFPF